MKFDKQTIVAVTLCVLGYIGYEIHLNKKYPKRYDKSYEKVGGLTEKTGQKNEIKSLTTGGQRSLRPLVDKKITFLSEEDLTIQTKTTTYKFDQKTGGLILIQLKDYKNSKEDDLPVNLAEDGPFIIQPNTRKTLEPYSQGYAAKRSGNTISFHRKNNGWGLEHEIKFDNEGYGGTATFSWINETSEHLPLERIVFAGQNVATSQKTSTFLPGIPTGRPAIITSYSKGEVERSDVIDLCKEKKDNVLVQKAQSFNLNFFGIDRHYFLNALIPGGEERSYEFLKFKGGENSPCEFQLFTSSASEMIKPKEKIVSSYKLWFGPKQTEVFESDAPILKSSLDFGWFEAFATPLLFALRLIHQWVNNWGVAIIILTVLLKTLLYPLTKSSHTSMQKTKEHQPEVNKIREKFKGDPQRMQQEIMALYKKHKINPMKGCLPILPTIPIFFAFYRVLSLSIELRLAPFFGWIEDLSVADPYYITPILLGGLMFLQQKLTPNAGMDKTQERMMMMMPLVFCIFMITLPAGLVLYMLTNSIVTILQQYWMNKTTLASKQQKLARI